MASRPPVSVHAIVVACQASGERFIRAVLLTPDLGLLSCLARRRSKPPPLLFDLFDQGEAMVELKDTAREGFLKEFVATRRRVGLGRDYARLEAASRLSRFILANPVHEENAAQLYELATRALDALDQGLPPLATVLKTFYVYGRSEGYPLAEDWFRKLPSELAQGARALLNTPLAEIDVEPSAQLRALEALCAYLDSETNIRSG